MSATTALAAGFDPVQWRSQANVERDNTRSGMIGDLERGKLRPGMTREEVHALLGPPESAEAGRDTWDLGQSAFGPSYEYYVVRYGADGRVAGFGMTRS